MGKLRSIKASLNTKDISSVKVEFKGDYFTPGEFTSLFMSILDTYTLGLTKTNKPIDVYNHWNSVFGQFLTKIIEPDKVYDVSKEHKVFKDSLIEQTGKEASTAKVEDDTIRTRLAAYLVVKDILMTDLGMTEESVDILLNKRLNLNTPETLAASVSKVSKRSKG